MSAPFRDEEVFLPIHDAKQAITGFAMYFYKSLVDSGYSSKDAKAHVAALLEDTYNHYCDIGDIEPKILGSVESQLNRSLDRVKALAVDIPAVRTIYDDLLALQVTLKKR
jgi:hypothetical protein